MSDPSPVTQRDIAQACGLHPSTICLALKNAPSIPLDTRQRVQAAAEKLGYQPNVAARHLALLRSERRRTGSLPIAWINQEACRDHWRRDPEARDEFEGARRRAAEEGYHLEEIWTREPGMTATRVAQIARARGIEGVIFPAHRSFDFSLLNAGWGDLALVGFNDHRLAEWVDVVCPDHYRGTAVALQELRRLGFDRIGLAITQQFDAASSGLASSCFLRYQADLPAAGRVPVVFLPDEPEDAGATLAEWLYLHRPDAVLCRDASLRDSARDSGHATVWVQLHGALAEFDGGTDSGGGETAAAAVDCVVQKMRRFEKGTRELTRVHLVKGAWQAGRLAAPEAQPVVA